MKKNKELDYVYASTRVRAAEGRGTARERLTSFAEAGSAEALTSAVVGAIVFLPRLLGLLC